MGEVPTTDNKVADFFDGLVKAGIVGGESALKAYILTTPAAILEGPVIHIFTDEVIAALGNALFRQTADLVAKVVIDIQVNLEESAAARAVTQLQQAKKSGDKDALDKANAAFDSAMAGLIHSDGSAHPA